MQWRLIDVMQVENELDELGQKTEVRRQKSEDRRPKTEVAKTKRKSVDQITN